MSVPVALSEQGVAVVWNALREARRPRLQVAAPVSAVQMEYLAGKKPDAMLQAIDETIRACRARCSDVEFAALDATRADAAFIRQAITAAIEAGATCVRVCDAAGAMLPGEFGAFLEGLYADIPALKTVALGVA